MYKLLKYILFIIPFFSIIVVFYPESFVIFGEIAFKLLILIMFVRPIRDIFPKKLSFLNYIVNLRKELGIIVGIFAIAHSVGYFLDTKLGFDLVFNINIWKIDNYMAWGFLAFFVTIPLLLTSNNLSMIKMGGKAWKRLQSLAYLMFIFTIVHVALIKDEDKVALFIILGIYIILLFTAWYKNKNKLINK